MGIYKDIDTDFALRTLRIIEQYDQAKQPGRENFEVTLLVNCFVGLLILPHERRMRLIPDVGNKQVRLGRVAVAAAHRRGGLAQRLMAEALARCRADYPGFAIALSAQAHLVAFYAGFGFTPVSPPYDDEGIPHLDMVNA